jgi:hypothetical protein
MAEKAVEVEQKSWGKEPAEKLILIPTKLITRDNVNGTRLDQVIA